MAMIKWNNGPAEISLMILPRPDTGRVALEVALMIVHKQGPMTEFKGASYTTYKHPKDKHDVFEAVKFALPKVLKKVGANKAARTEAWNILRSQFPVAELLTEYREAYLV